MMRSSWRAAGLLATVLTVSCSGDLLESGTPDAPSDPALEAMAIRLTVDLEAGVVRPAASQPAGNPAGLHLAYAILGTNEAGVTATNLVRSAPINGKVTVTFDAAVTNRMTAASLVPSTFPGSTSSPGLLLFPFRVTQVVGGSASQVLATTEWDGDGTPGSGAPRNFFNDFGCPAGSNDCFRWEQYPAPLGPGETTTARKVGFTLPRQITSFTVLLVLAADIANDLPGVASLSVTPPSYTFANGFPASFTATAYDSRGNPLPWATITWVTADITAAPFQSGGSLVGTITGPGVIVHARKVGPTSFTASSGGVSVTVPLDIQVNTVALVQVYVTPDSVLDVGETVQATAVVKDHSGQVIPGIAPLWDTSDPSVALVTVSGQIIAMGPGTVTVTATAGTQTGSAPITVSGPPFTGFVSGYVVASSLPIGIFVPGVDVEIAVQGFVPRVVTAHPTGASYWDSNVPAGPAAIRVLNPPPGCTSQVTQVTVTPGSVNTGVDVSLTCDAGGTVRFTDTGITPIANDTVEVTLGVVRQGFPVTDTNGEIVFSGAPRSTLTINSPFGPLGCFQKPGFQVTLSPTPATTIVNLACPGTGTISGRVTATGIVQFDGTPAGVPGSLVTAVRGYQYIPQTSGPDGKYQLSPAPIGDIQMQGSGGASLCGGTGVRMVSVLGRADLVEDFSISCYPHLVSVRVIDASAVSALPVVDVRIVSALTGNVFGGTIANDGGAYTFDILNDDASFTVYLANLPQPCSANSATGVADRLGLTTVALTLVCQ